MRTIDPRPAATVALLRPGPDGLEVLLTLRPTSMAFAGDMHVFPGGAVDPGDADAALVRRSSLTGDEAARRLGGDLGAEAALSAHVAAIRELFEEAGILLADGEVAAGTLRAARDALLRGTTSMAAVVEDLDLRLRPDLLAPLSHWTTPPILPRRFDTRFFAASLPAGAEASFTTDEVVAHRWVTPRAALEAMAAGEITMWLPTGATLQQLEHASSFAEVQTRLAPGRATVPWVVDDAPDVTRVAVSEAGGVPGQAVNTYLVGRREIAVIDPGDPSEAAAEAVFSAARARGGTIAAIALTHSDPDHVAGAEALALRLGVPVFAGIGADRRLPFTVRELAEGDFVGPCDVPLRAVATPGPTGDHVAYVVGPGSAVICGDLVGPRADRSIFGPADTTAWAASLDRLTRLRPVLLLPGHEDPLPPAALEVSGAATQPGSGGS